MTPGSSPALRLLPPMTGQQARAFARLRADGADRDDALVRVLGPGSVQVPVPPCMRPRSPVVGPDNRRYPTIRSAARAEGISDMAMRTRLTQPRAAWRLAGERGP